MPDVLNILIMENIEGPIITQERVVINEVSAPVEELHTEDIQDIVGSPPGSLMRWGITWVLIVLLGMLALTSFIRYPDVIKAQVRINAANAPKAVISRVSGNIVKILVKENDPVAEGQLLAWMESTADHRQILNLADKLDAIRNGHSEGKGMNIILDAPKGLRLGELQSSYQAFYQSYLTYSAATGNGIYLKRKTFIKNDLQHVSMQRSQLGEQGKLNEREFNLAEKNFERYDALAKKKIISSSEYEEQQAVFLAKQHPLQQTQSALLANENSYVAKMKELADLENQITEEKSKFAEALNSLISEIEKWKSQYILTARQSGTVAYTGIIQLNQYIQVGQEVFRIDPGSTQFFGEAKVPQYNMGKVKEGQEVLVKLDGYPFEEYGVLRGRMMRMTGAPYQDSIFLSKIKLLPITPQRHIQLTTGMIGTAEIITEDASLFKRLARNIRLLVDKKD